MQIEFLSEPVLRLHGYSPERPDQILARVLAGAQPSSLKGDFILVAEGIDAHSKQPLTVFVSTVIAAVPYYYCLQGTKLIHADNVVDCCRMAGLGWEWNWDALSQLALFDHVLGDISLHKNVSRIPAASVVKICNGAMDAFTEPFWDVLYSGKRYDSKLADATPLLLELLGELPESAKYSLSISAGYDSRVLLACMSYLGRDVQTACMGSADSTDPRIGEQLARIVGYDFERVPIEPGDYPANSEYILKITSGESSFLHWHTGIYMQKVGFDPSSIHLVGSNGEFARSFFFNKGFLATLLDFIRLQRWDKRLAKRYSPERSIPAAAKSSIDPGHQFTKGLDVLHQLRNIRLEEFRFGDALDTFYASQRVRNFIGLGLALYRSKFQTVSPFLDARFITYVAGLPRHDKLATRLHRDIIRRVRPQLLSFPTDESNSPMGAEPGVFYFLKNKHSKGYSRVSDAQKFAQVITWAQNGFSEIGGDTREIVTDLERWNTAITVGAFLVYLRKSKVEFPQVSHYATNSVSGLVPN